MQIEQDQLNILIVEDDKIDAYQLERLLRRTQHNIGEIVTVSLLDEALECCQNARYDMVLVDLCLPDSGESETVRQLRESFPNLPIVVITGRDHDRLGPNAISHGADDYLARGNSIPGNYNALLIMPLNDGVFSPICMSVNNVYGLSSIRS